MKKILSFILFFSFFTGAAFADNLPKELKERLLLKPLNGFITNTNSTGNSDMKVMLHFVEDEFQNLTGTITLYNYETGNGRFNFTRFIDVSYDYSKRGLIISFWPPVTRINTVVWILESTKIERMFISGLFLERPDPNKPKEVAHMGSFRLQ